MPRSLTLQTNWWRIDDHEDCRTFIVIGSGSLPNEEPSQSDFCSLGEGDGGVDIRAEVANSILHVSVTQQDLHGPQLALLNS